MRVLLSVLMALCLLSVCHADPGRIYTVPDPKDLGGIEGKTEIPLTHALAVDHERIHVYRAELTESGKSFRFGNLPVGKYDLVLVTQDHIVFEGLTLGDIPAEPDGTSRQNLQKRVVVADSFFNRSLVHRTGIRGDQTLLFVERIRDRQTLKQSGEKLGSNLRRLEIIELERAGDDWQISSTRHLYREEEPVREDPSFMKHFSVSGIGNLRVIDSVKQLGMLSLPSH
jgi:hypothetical protein